MIVISFELAGSDSTKFDTEKWHVISFSFFPPASCKADFLLFSEEISGLPVLLWRACHSMLVYKQRQREQIVQTRTTSQPHFAIMRIFVQTISDIVPQWVSNNWTTLLPFCSGWQFFSYHAWMIIFLIVLLSNALCSLYLRSFHLQMWVFVLMTPEVEWGRGRSVFFRANLTSCSLRSFSTQQCFELNANISELMLKCWYLAGINVYHVGFIILMQ